MKKTRIGPFIKCPTPEIVELCKIAGFDFAVIDMEHTGVTQRELYPLALAAGDSLELIVRIPENRELYFKYCLDIGIRTIQVPFVQSLEDVQYAGKMSHFAPLGERGLCRFVRAAQFSATPREQYLSHSNEKVDVILQIENTKGIDALPEIVRLQTVQSIFIGPYDLSQSLGVPGDVWNPKVTKVIESAILLAQTHGKKVGIFTDTPEGIDRWRMLGVDFIEYASDLGILLKGFSDLLGHARRSLT